MPERAAAGELVSLGSDFFETVHTADPFNATQLGVTGFDALVPDPSREGSARVAQRIAAIERRLADIDTGQLDDAGRIDHAVLAHLASAARSEAEHGLWEANISAGGYVSPQAAAFMSVPTALVHDAESARMYLDRLSQLGGFFDAVTLRSEQARADGRIPTAVGVRQAIEQLDGHLAKNIAADTLVTVPLPDQLDAVAFRAEAARVVSDIVRPAAARLAGYLRSELLPVARPDERVGIMFVPGGTDGYLAAVRRHTTTELSPDQIHRLGLDILQELDAEWAELGARVLATAERPAIFDRLRNDPALRFTSSAEIVEVVTAALRRAEAALGDWFPPLTIADCVIEEIDPVEAGNAPLAYYRPPTGDGLRPGAHCVLTVNPADRFSYEYEALAFHESVPGHHLQIASAQTLTGLPAYRRFLDAEVCGYVEGWGLYCERLADQMALYTSDLARLGMLSFDALRACRLVVDTGMHHHGWPRARAVEFMREHTATTQANVENEVNRYIGWPGQALAYMVGRREIQRLRSKAERRLGPRYDIKSFHGVVLGDGAVPLGVLDQLVDRWISQTHERP
jgi:uncharacterized protein (DUF885 family)